MTQPATSTHLSIGEVLTLLQADFPDVTISKIRFLESQGLVAPERTASGYRKFYDTDIERLRWILAQQRDSFLPLKVIKRMLDQGIDVAIDGDQPTLFADPTPGVSDDAGSAPTDEPSEPRKRSRAHPTMGGRNEPSAGAADGATSSADITPPSTSAEDAPRLPAAVGSQPEANAQRHSDSSEVAPAAPPTNTSATVERAERGTETTERRQLSTPADVVAALQEDPRGSRKKMVSATTQTSSPTVASRSGVLGGIPEGESLSRAELCDAAGIDTDLLASLEQFGLVVASSHGASPTYGPESLQVAVVAARCAELGIEPRHLRIYKVAAEREAGLLEQMIMPLLKQRNPVAREQAVERSDELLAIGAELHSILLRRQLGPLLGR